MSLEVQPAQRTRERLEAIDAKPVKRARRWRRTGSNRQPPACKAGNTDSEPQTDKGLATLPFCASPCASPSERENDNADGSPTVAFPTAECRQEGKSEGDGSTVVDLLTLDADAGLDLDALAVDLRRRRTAGDCRRLAEVLAGAAKW